MGHRLSKIYTRTGDDGSTGLSDGSRVGKDELRVAAMGDVDELNTQIGSLILRCDDAQMVEVLVRIQHHLFDLGGEMLTRPPRGFDKDNEHIEDIKRKSFIAVRNLDVDDSLSPQFQRKVETSFKAGRTERATP